MANKEIIQKFLSLTEVDDQWDFLETFDSQINQELAEFFIEVGSDKARDEEVRIAAINIIGFYLDDSCPQEDIKKALQQLVTNDKNDDDLLFDINVLNTLARLTITDEDNTFVMNLVKSGKNVDVRHAAFSILRINYQLPIVREPLEALKDDDEFGKTVQTVLTFIEQST